MFRKISDVFCDNQMNPKSVFYVEGAELLNTKPGGTYNYHNVINIYKTNFSFCFCISVAAHLFCW
jgi:hypothetical protein